MKLLSVIVLLACLFPTVSAESADPVWSATEPEGSCSRNGFQIINQTVEVGEDSTFSFRAIFTSLAGITQVFRGNLIKNEAELIYGRGDAGTRVRSFTAEQIGDSWELRIRFLFAGWSQMFVHSLICDSIFRLHYLPPTD
jgi:hypothetical protein